MVTMGCSEETGQTRSGVARASLPAASRVGLKDFLLNVVLHHCVSDNTLFVHITVSLISEPVCIFRLHDMSRRRVMKCECAFSGDLSFAGFKFLAQLFEMLIAGFCIWENRK